MLDTKNIWLGGFHLDLLPAYTCARANDNLWGICLGVSILRRKTKCEGSPVPLTSGNGNITLLNVWRTFPLPSCVPSSVYFGFSYNFI